MFFYLEKSECKLLSNKDCRIRKLVKKRLIKHSFQNAKSRKCNLCISSAWFCQKTNWLHLPLCNVEQFIAICKRVQGTHQLRRLLHNPSSFTVDIDIVFTIISALVIKNRSPLNSCRKNHPRLIGNVALGKHAHLREWVVDVVATGAL